MNKILRSLLLSLMTVTLFAGSASAAWKARTTTELNMRSGPSTRYGVVDVIPYGHRVKVYNCNGSWCKVKFRGHRGWASRSYLGAGKSHYQSKKRYNRKRYSKKRYYKKQYHRHYHGHNYRPAYVYRPFFRPRFRTGFGFRIRF
jgi:uncharacterized protein YraI